MSGVNSVSGSNGINQYAGSSGAAGQVAGETALPVPVEIACDDLMTALAVLTIKQRQADRASETKSRDAAAKAQDEAHEAKIAKMREQADDAFMQGVIEGVSQGISATFTIGSAATSFQADALKVNNGGQDTLESIALARDAKQLDGRGKLVSAAGTLGGAYMKSKVDDAKTDAEEKDRDIDRAKSQVDAASSEISKAAEDIRDTINAVRQYLAAKQAIMQASIMRA